MTSGALLGRSASVTVVVLNYVNGKALLLPCLEALRRQDVPDGFMKVRVVHNPVEQADLAKYKAQDDWPEVFKKLREDFQEVQVKVNPHNVGFAEGHNVAFRDVDTPLVAIINNDARPEPFWLRKLIAPFDGAGSSRLGAVTGKVVLLPRFLRVQLTTPGFVPGPHDTRELGVRIYRVAVNGQDVTEQVLWGDFAYGPEQDHRGTRFRWTRPSGAMLVPVDQIGSGSTSTQPLLLTLRLGAEEVTAVEMTWSGCGTTVKAEPDPIDVKVEITAGVNLVDVLNNVGSMVSRDGYGGDRAYREVDCGQYERPEEVFAFCGAAACFRAEALREADFFDDDFFLYYEDTDLSWRLRALGWSIRYEPGAVVRHIHSATSGEWSPLFNFHVERNRLLMLTKNARVRLVAWALLDYLRTTASCAGRDTMEYWQTRRRSALGPTVRHARVLRSYARLLPRMLTRRRALAARAVVDRRQLERWLVGR